MVEDFVMIRPFQESSVKCSFSATVTTSMLSQWSLEIAL